MKLIIIFMIYSIPAFAQLSLKGMAPLTPGNYWKYTTESMWGLPADSVSFLVLDSTVTISGQDYYVIKTHTSYGSTSYNRFQGLIDSFYVSYDNYFDDDSVYKYLKFNCMPGDTWTEGFSNAPMTFTVLDTFTVNAWGRLETAKEIYVEAVLIQLVQLWSDSLGLLSEIYESQSRTNLVACVINGQVYGDTSMYIITSIDDINPDIKEFELYQNYPNPFNPTTTIRFSISEPQQIKLTVYSLLGEEIKVLIDEYRTAGNHSILFNSEGLSSGVYIYTLRTDNKTKSKKFILLK